MHPTTQTRTAIKQVEFPWHDSNPATQGRCVKIFLFGGNYCLSLALPGIHRLKNVSRRVVYYWECVFSGNVVSNIQEMKCNVFFDANTRYVCCGSRDSVKRYSSFSDPNCMHKLTIIINAITTTTTIIIIIIIFTVIVIIPTIIIIIIIIIITIPSSSSSPSPPLHHLI